MLKTIFLVIYVAVAYRTPTFESGTETSVHWAPQPFHILHSGNQVPRSVDVVIKFKSKFKVEPQVAIANYVLDWESGSPQGFLINVVEKGLEQFTVRYTALSQKNLYTIAINWMAIDDPRVYVGYFETTELGPLKTGEGERQTTATISYPAFKEAPVGAAYLIGTLITKRNWLVFVNLKQISKSTAILNIKTWYITNVAMVKVCYVIGESGALWVSPDTSFRVPDNNHAWLRRTPQEAVVHSSIDVPREWAAEKAQLYGFTGWDVEESINMKVFVRDLQLNGGKASVQMGVWSNTQAYQMSYMVLLYRLDPTFKIFDPNCAELFSECNFEGDSITLCDKIESLPDQGWVKPIRSFRIPEQRALKMYNQESLRGGMAKYTGTQECIEGVSFSLIQITH